MGVKEQVGFVVVGFVERRSVGAGRVKYSGPGRCSGEAARGAFAQGGWVVDYYGRVLGDWNWFGGRFKDR